MAALGFRHGFDWDHIAAITDITSTTSASHTEAEGPAGAPMPSHGHDPVELRGHALGHAFVVLVLGVAALLLGAVLPPWVDPILEKVVGLTLVLLGTWVLFSV